MTAPTNQRVQKRRNALRAMGLRPLQIWVPDSRRPGFSEECQRQAMVVAAADAADRELGDFMGAALADLGENDE